VHRKQGRKAAWLARRSGLAAAQGTMLGSLGASARTCKLTSRTRPPHRRSPIRSRRATWRLAMSWRSKLLIGPRQLTAAQLPRHPCFHVLLAEPVPGFPCRLTDIVRVMARMRAAEAIGLQLTEKVVPGLERHRPSLKLGGGIVLTFRETAFDWHGLPHATCNRRFDFSAGGRLASAGKSTSKSNSLSNRAKLSRLSRSILISGRACGEPLLST
jgi:hypothetical protein